MNVLQQLQAGVRVEFNEAGRFLRILASEVQDKIRVQFYRNGAMICEALEVGRGFSETMEDGNFDSYAVTSSVTQNVNIVTRAGSKILYDTPPVGDVNVLSLPPVVIANPDAQKRYENYGASWKSAVVIAANAAEAIVLPVANVNGLVVWAASFSERQSATSAPSAMIAKASAPTTIVDGDVIVGSTCSMASAGSNFTLNEGRLLRPVLIPAGKGLYYLSGGTQDGASLLRSVLYTLL